MLAVVDLGRRLRALGNLVHVRGLVRYAVFYQVEEYVEDFEALASELAEGVGRAEEAAVFFTAADVFKIRRADGRLVDVYATVGLANPACLGEERAGARRRAGTVNLLVVSRAGLSSKGLLDLFRTAAEAKAAALTALGICGGRPALGTTSDAILVAAPPGRGDYAGYATELGAEAAWLVYEVLSEAA
ncbi:MAG: adenosylcobinamide amidohydrolase [Thermoproteus sp.]|nr:adenosylcobinamide amidohydrolase [Thermoproteus sp.]